MELDDFKSNWDKISGHVSPNQNINFKIFDTMKRNKFRNKLKSIILPEVAGSIVCFASVVYIGANFNKFETIPYQAAGMLSMALFVILPLISFRSIQYLYKAADVNKPYAETLKDFATAKIKFTKLQKLNLTLCYLLAVTVILLSTRLFGRNHKTDSNLFFIVAYGLGYSLLVIFSKWVFKKYNKTIHQTEDFLQELSV